MIEFLKGGIIKGRKVSISEEELSARKRQAIIFRNKGLTNREIGKRMKTNYNTIAAWLVPEARY